MAIWPVPTAAIGLAVVMVGAVITHLRSKEYPNVVANVLLVLAVFVAVERTGQEVF